MKETRLLMGMPITVEVVDDKVTLNDFDRVYSLFRDIDERFSLFKDGSEISRINRGEIDGHHLSAEMKTVLALCEETKIASDGYFDIAHRGQRDPSGLVKGWAIFRASSLLKGRGFKDFYVDAGGDIQVSGYSLIRQKWKIGIRNPFNTTQTVKTVSLTDRGIATSGTYERGQHIYNPKAPGLYPTDIVSLTVIGPNVYEAYRFATAAFAMGKMGIEFIENLTGFEGYQIDKSGTAVMTSGFTRYL